jgi:hypothetical protein
MKKIAILAMLVLSLGTLAQTPSMTSGRFNNIPLANKGYNFSKEDFVEYASICMDSVVTSTKWFTLSSGIKVQILHPAEWLSLILQCYQVIDSSVTKENLLDAIKASDEAVWTNTQIITKNYYWADGGGIDCMNPYNGSAHAIPIIEYKGYPVIKRSCGNPLLCLNIVKAKPVTIVYNNPPQQQNQPQQQQQQQQVYYTPQYIVVTSGAIMHQNYNGEYEQLSPPIYTPQSTVVTTGAFKVW